MRYVEDKLPSRDSQGVKKIEEAIKIIEVIMIKCSISACFEVELCFPNAASENSSAAP